MHQWQIGKCSGALVQPPNNLQRVQYFKVRC